MLIISNRKISDEERQNLKKFLPSLLFKKRRSPFLHEIAEGIVEVLEFEVSRAWSLNNCRPPCCPHSYVFQVEETKFVYGESWAVFNLPENSFPKRKMSIVRSPITKRILSIHVDGEVLSTDTETFDSMTDYFPLSDGAECEVFEEKDLSEEVWFMLTTPHNKLVEATTN